MSITNEKLQQLKDRVDGERRETVAGEGGERSATTHEFGGERVAESVSVKPGLTETQAPATEDLRDAVRREIAGLHITRISDDGCWGWDEYEATLNNLCRLFAERDRSRSRLAPELIHEIERLQAKIDRLQDEREWRHLDTCPSGIWVLVHCRNYNKKARIAKRRYDGWEAMDDLVDDVNPTHWMPLPKPPDSSSGGGS